MPNEHRPQAAGRNITLVVSSVDPETDPAAGLGVYGYSYDVVRRSFQPVLQRFGEVVDVRRPESQLEFALRRARRLGGEGVHLSFRPFSDVYLARGAKSIVFPAWAFPDIPCGDFKQNPRFNWVRIADHCSLVIAHSEFTAGNLRRAGVRTPIRVVPVPIDEGYFRVPAWDSKRSTTLDCTAYVFTRPEVPPLEATDHELRPGADTLRFRLKTRLKGAARRIWIKGLKRWLPGRLAKALVEAKNAGHKAWLGGKAELPQAAKQLKLSGVVYTTILNPVEKRKNWQDLLTAFLFALRDCDDATLVVKLVTRRTAVVGEVLGFYDQLGIAHRSRVAFVTSDLSDEQMLELTRASAFYLNASRAEGVGLPVLDFLAAGRPAIAPSHTAIAEHIDETLGFVVESDPEPCPWPHDESGRLSTTWHRVVWSSLRDQIARSYRVARGESPTYSQLASQGRARMRSWASREIVWARLAAALELVGVAPPPAMTTASDQAHAA